MKDVILHEVREIKRQHAEQYDFDVLAMCHDIMKSQKERQMSGWTLLPAPIFQDIKFLNVALQATRTMHRC